MEAANVIWVKDSFKNAPQRSNMLRAIHKLGVIDTDSSSWTVGTGFKVDDTFAKCHCYKPWIGNLYWCKSCRISQPILLCRRCADVCHPSCGREFTMFRSVLHLVLQYNPCSCQTSGRCKLKNPTRKSSWLTPAALIAIAGVLVSLWIHIF